MARLSRRLLLPSLPPVSLLGLGTVKFGRNTGVKYPEAFELPSDREILDLLALARDLGINLLDTAPAYGSSMERLGRLLPGVPQDWLIVCKVGETYVNGQSLFDFSHAGTLRSVESSLRILGRETIDLMLIHSNGEDERILREEGVVDALLELQQRGLVRATGLSGKTVEGGLLALERLDTAMVTCHPGYLDERPVLERAAELGRGVLIKKALASGHVSDPTAALGEVAALPGVASIILGTLNPRHLRDNVAAVCFTG